MVTFKIIEASNGWVVELWSVPVNRTAVATTFAQAQQQMLELYTQYLECQEAKKAGFNP